MNDIMIYVSVFFIGVAVGMLICEYKNLRKDLW